MYMSLICYTCYSHSCNSFKFLVAKQRVVNFLLTSSRLIVRCILSSQVRRGSWTTPIGVFYSFIPLGQGENPTGKTDLRLSPSKCGSQGSWIKGSNGWIDTNHRDRFSIWLQPRYGSGCSIRLDPRYGEAWRGTNFRKPAELWVLRSWQKNDSGHLSRPFLES